MSRACTVCTHPKRSEIEISGANGASNRSIAAQFCLSATAVRRHMTEHIKQAAKDQHARREEAKTLDVLAQLRAINATTLKILHHCQADPKKWGLALHAIDIIHGGFDGHTN